MAKIPVGATIAHAYRFAFGNIVQILRVVWVTWAVMAVLSLLMMRMAMGLSTAMATQDLQAVGSAIALVIPFYLLILLLLFVQISGIARLALGLPTGSPYHYFSLDRPVWRLVGKSLLAVVILIGGYIVLIVGGILLAAAGHQLGGGAGVIVALAAVVVVIGGFLAYIYGAVRLTFFITPVAINEGRSELKRSWALGRSNFWRAFAVLLAIFLPVIVLEFAWLFGPWGPGLPPSAPLGATADQLAANRAQMAQWNQQFADMMISHWYISVPAFLVVTVLVYGAMVGAQCFAYRAVTQAPDGPWSSASPP